jgi:hypothetical protein
MGLGRVELPTSRIPGDRGGVRSPARNRQIVEDSVICRCSTLRCRIMSESIDSATDSKTTCSEAITAVYRCSILSRIFCGDGIDGYGEKDRVHFLSGGYLASLFLRTLKSFDRVEPRILRQARRSVCPGVQQVAPSEAARFISRRASIGCGTLTLPHRQSCITPRPSLPRAESAG